MEINSSKRLVIKIGSRLLIDEEQKQFNMAWLVSLIDDIAVLARQGIKVLIVTSGSVACGNIALGLNRAQLTLDKQQAAAAVGQIQLIHTYQTLLDQQGMKTAQILLSMNDIETRRRYINLRNTLESLLKMNVIPIINENDSIATAEIRYGDNDRLAARVAQMVEADTLLLLSDVAGLYTQDPRKYPDAEMIPEVRRITPEILEAAQDSSTHYGSGGMKTKIAAAQIAMASGVRMLIMAGAPRHPIHHYNSTKVGTWFIPQTTQLSAKKIWLKEHLKPEGFLQVDAGAAKALASGKSLLPVGVTGMIGRFDKGDLVCIKSPEQQEIARGLVNYSEVEINKIMGHASHQLSKILGYAGCEEVIHRNNLVITQVKKDKP